MASTSKPLVMTDFSSGGADLPSNSFASPTSSNNPAPTHAPIANNSLSSSSSNVQMAATSGTIGTDRAATKATTTTTTTTTSASSPGGYAGMTPLGNIVTGQTAQSTSATLGSVSQRPGSGGGFIQQGGSVQHGTSHQRYPSGTVIEGGFTETTRKVSSVVVEEQVLGDYPRESPVKYVDVPTVEERVSYITKKETVEVEKQVKVPYYDWVEKVVEVPRIQYVDRTVEVPRYQEVVKEVRVPQVIERPREVVREVKVPRVNYVEQVREVPGQTIEVPKPYTVEQRVEVPRPVDKEVPVIVAQTIKPIITESAQHMVVDVNHYEPEIVPVDVHIAKPVASALEVVGQVGVKHKLVNITGAQYNTILKMLNAHMDDRTRGSLPFVSENGRVNFIEERDANFIVAPDHITIEGWTVKNNYTSTSYPSGAYATSGPIPAYNGVGYPQQYASSPTGAVNTQVLTAGTTPSSIGNQIPGKTTTTTTTTTVARSPNNGYPGYTNPQYATNNYPLAGSNPGYYPEREIVESQIAPQPKKKGMCGGGNKKKAANNQQYYDNLHSPNHGSQVIEVKPKKGIC